MDLKETEVLGGDIAGHWYYRAKAAAMLRLLGPAPIDSVLDVGAGSGFFSRHLLDNTNAAEATCVDPNYEREHVEQQNGKPIRFVHQATQFGGHLVLMMDVLEHVPDDLALLSEYVALAPRGSRFLITVPAFRWMWSGHDVFLGHYRRYTLAEIDALIAKAGLKRIQSGYYYGLTLPLAAAVRFARKLTQKASTEAVSDMRPHSKTVNAMLWAISKAELGLMRANRLGGLSVVCLAQS